MPTGTSTGTRTAAATSTATKIVDVTRKVQADFLSILETYRYFSEDYAQHLIHDVRVFLDEEVIDHIQFVWTRPDSTYVLEELNYKVVVDGVKLSDDRSGGIRYQPTLANASFHVRVIYNLRWKDMAEREKSAIREDLDLNWGSANQLNYSGGKWTTDRTYSKDGYGLVRQRFERS
jgi:Bacterial HORMA domain family 1